ncbi:hypothetical protein RHSIM_Rhsim01G0121800 [Rhododendron simsii]|uniref:Retrotransposon Copia-like N-terminal domain-containing protein n=1 Tax=Rhododendron simsii TaxID=118357 RepID=A0A834HFB4_RHOSS|nr:hypothetical protein RHSIM_Rhsim01G0121800 [Rhododendron simsii]
MASSTSTNNTSTTTATSSPMDQKYPYPTEFNVRDFVPIELSRRNYDKWSRLMSDFIQSRGLIGFIDGTVQAPALDAIDGGGVSGGNQDYYYKNSNHVLWKRSDNLVRGWILATLAQDTRLSVLRFETAEDVWNELRKMFDLTMNLYGYDGATQEKIAHYLPLYIASISGDWEKASGFIENEPECVRTHITLSSKTMLNIAIRSSQRNGFVRKLLEKMSPKEVIDLVDCSGLTALHVAADHGNIDGAKMLVRKNPDLPNVKDNKGFIPLNLAAARGSREMVLFLMEKTKQEVKLMDGVGEELLRDLIISELYDMALTLFQLKPELGRSKSAPLLDILVEKYSSFPSGTPLNFWQKSVYEG